MILFEALGDDARTLWGWLYGLSLAEKEDYPEYYQKFEQMPRILRSDMMMAGPIPDWWRLNIALTQLLEAGWVVSILEGGKIAYKAVQTERNHSNG